MTGTTTDGLAARHAAIELLSNVFRSGQPFDELFQKSCSAGVLQQFEARDRALVRLICATVLRRKGQIEDALSRFLERPLPNKSGRTRETLLVAAAQLLFLDTPPHAAIDLAVRCAASERASTPFKGLVNAVLRRLSENALAILEEQNAPRLNTPPWLWQSWCDAYGADRALDIALAHLREPPLDLSVRSNPNDWAARLSAHLMPTGSIRLVAAGRIVELDGYEEGAWWVQDAAAALPARLLGNPDGAEVLELCAAPGGKTAQLAASGARVTAVDVNPARMARLEENLRRLGLSANCVTAQAADYSPDPAPQLILLDAPCSSTGTIRRHPDIAHTKTEKSVQELAGVQQRMLDHALGILAPGGTLVFCTCSLQPEEGEHHAARVLQRGDVARRAITPSEVGGMVECVTADGDLRTLPCHYTPDDSGLGGLDGFFAMRLQKL